MKFDKLTGQPICSHCERETARLMGRSACIYDTCAENIADIVAEHRSPKPGHYLSVHDNEEVTWARIMDWYARDHGLAGLIHIGKLMSEDTSSGQGGR